MATVTKPIILNETYSEKMEELITALAGVSKGAAALKAVDVAEGTTRIRANAAYVFPELTGALEITFADADDALDNEWIFIVTQGESEQSITLPDIDWYLGIAPTFEANSVTEVRVHAVGGVYKGVWLA